MKEKRISLYIWKCQKCGNEINDWNLNPRRDSLHREERLYKFRNGMIGEELTDALALIPDDEIEFPIVSFRCPNCNNLRGVEHICTSRPSFNKYVVDIIEHHRCDLCNHEMVPVTKEDRNHGLLCPKCGAKMKIKEALH